MAERIERRLTTILSADIAEYSRLMRADEDGTLALLTRCREGAASQIAEHRGRIANTAGDAVLAEFPSVADGLACALAIQEAVGEENEGVPADRRMRFRIGNPDRGRGTLYYCGTIAWSMFPGLNGAIPVPEPRPSRPDAASTIPVCQTLFSVPGGGFRMS